MPIYHYRCPNGHEFEEVRTVAEKDQPVSCGECGQSTSQTIPQQVSGRVTGGTPTFFPGRKGK